MELGDDLTAIAMCCFAFSTILGWDLRSKMCRVCIYNKGCETIYDRVCAGRNLGATVDLGIIWGIADTCNGLMSILTDRIIPVVRNSGKLVKRLLCKTREKELERTKINILSEKNNFYCN